MTKICLIWDFDSAIGQINSQYPYNYNYKNLLTEIENVRRILTISESLDGKMVFAISGFSAEEGVFPYSIKELIVEIYQRGHEIASHSWKHEWFPFLDKSQILKSLTRSKKALESCIGVENTILGFIPPFNRPMSWYKKLSFSLGDKKIGYKYPGSNLSSLLPLVSECGYKWIRITYNPILEKLFKIDSIASLSRKWQYSDNIFCVHHNYCGFDRKALELIEKSIALKSNIIITGHPIGLSLNGKENIRYFMNMVEKIKYFEDNNQLQLLTMQEILGKTINE